MYLSMVAWDLSRSTQTVESLRAYLRDYAVDAYAELNGMRLKAWFANPEQQVWGAVYLWDSTEHMSGPLRVSRAVELIGYEPTSFGIFEVEAVAEGRHSIHADLTGIGHALTGLVP